MFWKGQSIPLPYPQQYGEEVKEGGGVAGRKKVVGRSFHHGRFVQQLRKAASLQKGVKVMEATVSRLVEEEGEVKGVEYKVKNELKKQFLFAPLTIVCDGLFSNFRKHFIGETEKVQAKSSFVALILEECELPYENHGHVILMDPSPTLCYPISSREARVLVDVPHPLPNSSNGDLKHYLHTVTAPQLPLQLRDAFLDALEKERLRSMPCGTLHPKLHFKKGAILVGDAFNVRNPLTGAGMTIALSDVCILSGLLEGVKDFKEEKLMLEKTKLFHKQRKDISSTINILAQALYEVFAASSDEAMPLVRQACFDYFKLGGVCVDGPMSLLSGLKESPATLVTHFFAVALYGVGSQLLPFPWPSNLYTSFKMLKAATNVIWPLMSGEHLLDLTYPNNLNIQTPHHSKL